MGNRVSIKVTPSLDDIQPQPKRSTLETRVDGLRNPITPNNVDVCESIETGSNAVPKTSRVKKKNINGRIRKFFAIFAKKSRSRGQLSKEKEPFLERMVGNGRSQDRIQDDPSHGEEKTSYSSTYISDPGKDEPQEVLWGRRVVQNHMSTVLMVSETGRSTTSLDRNRLVPMAYGKADTYSILEQSIEEINAEEQYMKDYSEGYFSTENPFKKDKKFTFLVPPYPPNELDRLAKLATYGSIKDVGENLKGIVALTQNIFKTKAALISVIQRNSQCVYASVGLGDAPVQCHTGPDQLKFPRESTFCAHAILQNDAKPLVVPDATKDWRFARNPHVIGEPYVRFYAGAPLRTPDGFNLGTLCIFDPAKRDFSLNDQHILMELAAVTTREFVPKSSSSRVCHINQMFTSQFINQAPYYESVQDIFDYTCRSISKTLKSSITFILEVTSLAEKKFLVRAALGLSELSANQNKSHVPSFEIKGPCISQSDGALKEHSKEYKEVNTETTWKRNGSFSEKRTRGGLEPELRETVAKRPSLRETGRLGSIRTIRILEDIVDREVQSEVTDVSSVEPVENFTHQELVEFLFPQANGFCCCTMPYDGRLGIASLFDLQRFCPMAGAEKLLFGDPQSVKLESDLVRRSSIIPDCGPMYIIGAFSKDPAFPLTDCQLSSIISFATALSSVVSHHKTEVALKISEADVRKEKELLSALVNNILPPVYAERLKTDKCAVADRFSNCSILFADIVGFTTIGGKMTADELVGMLNKIFIRFDMIAEDLFVEKIKTIGDCYMAATGVPVEQHDHAEIMAEFALALLAAVKTFNKTSNIPIQIRVGINSGPVVAGAIGHSKFVYDLWGHAVNIAQRMEAGSEAGRINVSQDTYRLLQNKYRFTSRGTYPVKGAGHMEMFFLEGRLDETRDEDGLLPEEALIQDIEASIASHNVLGRLLALEKQNVQQSSTARSGGLGLAGLFGSLCELGVSSSD